jgi:hypothetical protein
MNAKKILAFFLLVTSLLFLTAFASAASITSDAAVEIDGVEVVSANTPSGVNVSVVSGDTITVKVKFTVNDLDASTAAVDGSASNVRIRAELEGDTKDTTAVSSLFDVEAGKTYTRAMTLKVPADFEEDELNSALKLNLKIWNSDHETEVENIMLNVQRPSYEVAIKSVMTGRANAGDVLPVDVVLKNTGYNDADDIYVTASISELDIQKSGYFGDLVNVFEEETSSDEDDTSTANGRLNLELPYTVKPGTYSLIVEVESDDGETSSVTKKITIANSVPDVAIKSGSDLILLNPTAKLAVYTVKYGLSEATAVVSAGGSKSVPIETSSEEDFDVLVYSGKDLLSTVKFSGKEAASSASPVFVLTIVLAVVFFVLLVVLVVLITKKPQKAEEFGESYY